MLKQIAKEANQIEDELWIPLDAVMHKLTQEVWEFNDAIQKYRWIYCKSRTTLDDVKAEAGDMFFNFISVLNRLGIDPDELSDCAKKTLEKFHERKNLYKSNTGGKD